MRSASSHYDTPPSSASADALKDPTPGSGSPIRLLVVSSDTYPPMRVDVSVLFGMELAGRGHQIDWILQSENACDRSYEIVWGRSHVWVGSTDLGASLFHRIRKHVRSIRHDLKLFGVLRRGNYDAIEVKDKFVSGLFAMVAKRWYRKRFIYWLSFPYPEEYLIRASDGTARYPFLYRIRGHAFRVLLYKILLPTADHVFVQSEQMRRDIGREGIPLSRMTAVPMGFDPARFRAAPAAVPSRIDPAEYSVLYLGTLSKVRRLDFVIRAFAQVKQRIADARLYLVGGGDDPTDEQLLHAEAARLHLESSIVFVGRLPQAQALEYVRDAAVCLSPFYPTPILNSTSPTKLVEYMAMGKAVVANDHPEQRLVIEESGGGICVPWDEGAFAAAIVELLNSPEKRRQLGALGRDYAMRHRTYGVIADIVESRLLATVSPRDQASREAPR
jgi:glycosyltransferase involved in cell wall biosynthesis